ncbi:saccharopine dehydrogenase NADP-binding domain-containing protein [Oculatella sp. LEGE 06141]|uniref:saccharopine dehydrogenase family protein n=1 Tax=Oculatella sp. LEGE 06141 TaxID=1828648 RepID=UPI001880EF8F|nr:saccharopine dehydrogenase NADP-binding domain-containing protein [Oculatella sp. LEGE 06141]MBE9177253.1 saccharopine dehydrogenase NADP-binding domain-containing protein [Oculatella sp. LEGE 06141]
MANRVLILGGRGRIGSSVARDLATHTKAQIVATGRTPAATDLNAIAHDDHPIQFLSLDLANLAEVEAAIASLDPASANTPADLVIHCAGPFHYRDASVLNYCIERGINYLDVSDNVTFTRKVLARHEDAAAAGITAIVNSGIFPGISNSMVRRDVEQLDSAEKIHLSYVVGGSGGAGITVMRTTFLGLMHPFKAWIDGTWQTIKPYSDRQLLQLPDPYGKVFVYWYEMPETFTLVDSFPVKTVVTKFGSVPDFYNRLTWIAAHIFPKSWIQNPSGTEFLANVSYRMTQTTDPFSGIGVGIRSEVTGQKDGDACRICSTLVHNNTAIAAGYGTGSIAELLLSGQLHQPGVYPVEQVLSTPLFEKTMRDRGIHIQHEWLPPEG